VLLPNKMTYYFFSDGHTHSFKEAIFAIHQVRPLC
jgi:YHS domain-containing protein